jgi:hypothetical protein
MEQRGVCTPIFNDPPHDKNENKNIITDTAIPKRFRDLRTRPDLWQDFKHMAVEWSSSRLLNVARVEQGWWDVELRGGVWF